MTATLPLSEDRIRTIAYSLWLEEGCPEGRAETHWLKAVDLAAAEATPEPKARKAAPRRKAASEIADAAPAPAPRKRKATKE